MRLRLTFRTHGVAWPVFVCFLFLKSLSRSLSISLSLFASLSLSLSLSRSLSLPPSLSLSLPLNSPPHPIPRALTPLSPSLNTGQGSSGPEAQEGRLVRGAGRGVAD